ncbi:stage II sporulation protein R [Tissierella praeacuta DSM 18095]|uniref:Stage II sporulation protein R n=1 Tax=Tissierella praeacuta DSM 18095 TaxID=1123404 RepID=A0A1M4XT64_9FIRM|nr:stage II sporulation protein R [Tissierella praeacuta]SHE96671.1 stage II sporulation protein R [Tissierella praeacuta DSM 18095]SUO99183.1 stage II sporulation protein R [Tissierella praeacuta]
MKYKKLVLILSIFIFSFVYIICPFIEKKVKKSFEDEIIRFHIRANSDKEEDQALKLKIRDEILKEMKEKFKYTKTLEESREVIRENMKEMKDITERVIQKEGKDYDVAITLDQDNFPTRKYGNLVLPSGEYETLLITLGEGKGQNWWCIMFPPLCFVDITHSVAYNVEKELDTKIEEPQLKLKWKTAELIKKNKKIKTKIKSKKIK